MSNKNMALARPLWLKHAEEAKLKEEEQKAAAAKAAFDATFKDVEKQDPREREEEEEEEGGDASSSDSEPGYGQGRARKPVGPVDPARCTAAGTGVGGGAAGSVASFVVVTKDSDGRRLSYGGAGIKVRITPDAAVGAVEQEAVVKDHGDGTYSVTYAVTKRGNYMVSVECNGQPIQGNPFPVFFSGGNVSPPNGVLPASGNALNSSSFSNGVGSSLPSFPHVMPSLFSGILGMIPGVMPGATGGAILPGLAASFGAVCCDYLNGKCSRTDCKLNHPPLQQLMAAFAAGNTMGGLSQMPMAPSAAAMAAAQSIVVAQAYQAAQARAAAASKEMEAAPVSLDDVENLDTLSRTLQVSNLSPLLTAEQLRQLFSYCGTVTDCQIADSKHLAFVEYAKASEAKAALDLNNIEVGGRPLNVEMAKSLPAKKLSISTTPANSSQPPPLPVIMQQAVAMQQLQFQQALLMQQAVATQQVAAARQASVKTAAEMAAVRAAEISKRLKGDVDDQEDKEGPRQSRSPSRTHRHSIPKSRSPSRHHRDHCSWSHSRSPIWYRRDHRSRTPSRDRFHYRGRSRDHSFHYRGDHASYSHYYSRHERCDRDREHDFRRSRRSRHSQSRSRSKPRRRSHSGSPHYRKERSQSPKRRREKRRSRHHSLHRRSPSREVSQNVTSVKKGDEYADDTRSHSGSPRHQKERSRCPKQRREEKRFGQHSRHLRSSSRELSQNLTSVRRGDEQVDDTRSHSGSPRCQNEQNQSPKQRREDRRSGQHF